MNFDLEADAEFGDEAGFTDFLAANELNHQQQQYAMLGKGFFPSAFPLYSDPKLDPNWLGTHYLMHLEQFDLLGLGSDNCPDISQCDFSKPDQYADWMNNHAYIHDVINSVLGILT